MTVVENAILYLSSLCDGALSEDGAGWNKFDSHFGHSLAAQIQAGRPLTYKQRRAVNRIIRKYKRQFLDWDIIEEALPGWVNEAKEKFEAVQKQKKQEADELPLLDYREGKFYIKTTFEQNHIAKAIPNRRWIKEEKSWRYLDKEDTLQALAKLIEQTAFKKLTASAIERMEKYQEELELKEAAKRKVQRIKSAEEVNLDLPLKTKPYNHQIKAIQIGTSLNAAALLMEQGTGKTLAAIGIATHRFLKGQIKRLLVIAPKAVLPEWSRQFEEHTDLKYKAEVLSGSKKREILTNWVDEEGLNIAIINYESTWRLEEELSRWKPDMIICDESQKIKNVRAKQSKSIINLGKIAKYKLILTGTPVSQTPLDFFSQYKFLDPSIFGYSYRDFESRYAIKGGYGGYQILGYQNLEELAEKAHSIAYRVTKEEAIDLPEAINQNLYVELEDEAQELYKKMADESLLSFSEDEHVTAPIILTRLMRLQQITGGFLRSDETDTIYQVSKAKLNLLKETVEDLITAGKKLVIFARFIPEIDAISGMLKAMKIRHHVLKGGTKNPGKLYKDFQTNPETKIFVAQIATGGVGITLTAADTAIFYSMDFSLTNYEQAKARIHRIGQKKKVTYIHLIAQKTIDKVVATRLQAKQDMAKLVVDDLKNIITLKEENQMAKAKGKKSLQEKLEELKEEINELPKNEVPEIDGSVEAAEETEAITKDAVNPSASAKKSGKEGKKSSGKAKKPAVEDDPKESDDKSDSGANESTEMVTVADLAEEMGISPTVLRKKLRNSDFKKPSGRWEWPVGHPDIEAIKEQLAE